MSNATTQPEQVVRDFFAWQGGDESKIDVISESVDVYNPGMPDGEVHSRDELEAYLRDVWTGFPDIHFSIEEMVASDEVVMAEVKITGTHAGEFQGLPPTGREVEFWGMDKILIADGTVEEWNAYYDTQELADQLGLTFPAVIGQLPSLAWNKLRMSL